MNVCWDVFYIIYCPNNQGPMDIPCADEPPYHWAWVCYVYLDLLHMCVKAMMINHEYSNTPSSTVLLIPCFLWLACILIIYGLSRARILAGYISVLKAAGGILFRKFKLHNGNQDKIIGYYIGVSTNKALLHWTETSSCCGFGEY